MLITELNSIRPVLEGLISNMEDNINYQSYLDAARIRLNIRRNQNTKDQRQRPKRNIKHVNYSGMDMSDEDEGNINIYKPWFENGKVIEKCSKRLLCEVNDLDDEDYVFEDDEDDDEDDDDDEDNFLF